MSTLMKILAGLAATVVVLIAAGAYFLLPHANETRVSAGVSVIYYSNRLSRLGASTTVVDTSDGLVLIDTQLAPLAGSLQKTLNSRGDGPIVAFNTHWHPDHSGGNERFTGTAEIIAHENARTVLSQPQEGFGLTKPGSHHTFPAVPGEALPERLVDDELTIDVGGVSFLVVHAPSAHTAGDLVVFADELGFVAVGDLVWPNAFPHVDVGNGGSATGLLAAIDMVLDRVGRDAVIIPGHADPIGYDDLVAYRAMVASTISVVRRGKEAGRSLDELVDAGLPSEWSSWASPLVREGVWIEMIHNSLP